MPQRKGQHFLISSPVAEKILEIAEVAPTDVVLEIGPGRGALTDLLVRRARKVIALEIDENLVGVLKEKFSQSENIEILHTDALKYDYDILPEGVKIVANLPYYISTPLIRRLLRAKRRIALMALMFQKEVAQRIVAAPGLRIYGALSIFVQLYADPAIKLIVPPSCFSPKPRVDSAVVRFVIRSSPRIKVSDEKEFEKLVGMAFSMRRKTLLNILSKSLSIPRGEACSLLNRCGVDPQRRPETLSIEEFISIANVL